MIVGGDCGGEFFFFFLVNKSVSNKDSDKNVRKKRLFVFCKCVLSYYIIDYLVGLWLDIVF